MRDRAFVAQIIMAEKEEKKNKEKVTTFRRLQEVFDVGMLWADRSVLRLICAATIGNQMIGDAIWLCIVSSSSGGKTELLSSLDHISVDGKKTIWPVAEISANAFLSGMKRTGVETSLLHRMPIGGILTFKDFTTILSKRIEERIVLFGQLRQIYDGEFEKTVGTGDDIVWTGKVGALAASTEAIHKHMDEMAIMGHRFIFYTMSQPERKAVLHLMLDKKEQGIDNKTLRAARAEAMSQYIEHVVGIARETKLNMSREMQNDLVDVADFCTRARSAVDIDKYKGYINFVPAKDMPMRMFEQLLMLAQAFGVMNLSEGGGLKGTERDGLSDDDMNILYKIAFDSIPVTRRIALKYLAKYKDGLSTAGFATDTGYQTPVVAGWLAQINALGICDRIKSSGPQGDKWILKEEYRGVISKFEHITVVEDQLIDEEAQSEDDLNEQFLKQAEQRDSSLDKLAGAESFNPREI